jgi:predicted outer membrane repeat protein
MFRALILAVSGAVVLAPVAAARTWIVDPLGTGDALTIQAGIDSASAGDTVRVASGTHYEHDIVMKSGVTLWSQTTSPTHCSIDAGGQGRVIVCDGVDDTAQILGFTITGGHAVGMGEAGSGGGIACLKSSSPAISTCDFIGNTADAYGGAIYCGNNSSPSIQFCFLYYNTAVNGGGGLACRTQCSPYLYKTTFKGNSTPGDGGGIYSRDYSSLDMMNCTFLRNWAAGSGGGLFSYDNSQPSLVNCLVSFSLDGEGVHASDENSIVLLACTDIYGNEGGDWVGHIASQNGTSGNFSADPLYCDTSWYYTALEECSPCMPGYHPDAYDCGTTIGANIGYGCGCGEATQPTTWGTIKSLYR